MIAKYSGILGIGVLWLSVGVSLFITRFNVLGNSPISYLGTYPQTKYIFNTGLILASVLLLTFAYHIRHKLAVSKAFLAVFTLGQVCQIIVALTPYTSKTILRPIHIISGFVLAITLPLSIGLFAKTAQLSKRIRTTSLYLFYGELLLFVLGISWFVLASSGGALSEIITAIVFDVWIITLSLQLKPSVNAGGAQHALRA